MSVFESLSHEQQMLITQHLNLVIEANRTINLTRIDSVEEGMMLHVEDSLEGLNELNAAPEGLYGDIGSGAGYPGIPLAIASGRPTVLIDARKKKMDTMASIISKLGLEEQITTYAGRAELYARTQSKRFVALTARALAQLPVLMELACPLLKKDGALICYKAQLSDKEYDDARRLQDILGMSLEDDRSFMLNDEYNRRILTFRKVTNPTIALPRQESQAQKHPLSEMY